jgi:hypothetical protein
MMASNCQNAGLSAVVVSVITLGMVKVTAVGQMEQARVQLYAKRDEGNPAVTMLVNIIYIVEHRAN